MKEGYLRCLKNLILPAPSHKHYHLLLNELYSREFIPVIKRDENRAIDGRYLRDELGFEDYKDEPCSILEMLIALSGRFDGNSGFDPEEAYDNFWILMKNLGLDQYDDVNFSRNEVWSILYILENRTYSFSGKGGLFPLKRPRTDQRKVEIWDQMQEWLIENYGI